MKINASELKSIFSNIDLFICSSGFESRSKSVALALNAESIKSAFVFHIDENYTLAHENLKELQNRIPQFKKIEHPKNNPIETYDLLCTTFKEFYQEFNKDNKLRIVIDVTTFTREVLLILFKALNQQPFIGKSKVCLIYTPAENYPCDWLTKGVRYIRSIFGYSGMILPSKKLMLIILNGFENERTEEIINSFEPNGILLGKPSHEDSINEELSIRGESKFEFIKEKNHSKIKEEFQFSCIEVDKTIIVLETLIEKYKKEYNIILSPLNNKVSTIAAAIVALKNENIQVCYASANQYNINQYSVPCDYFLMFEMNSLLEN
ncbi:hypothetical protein [Emticicia fluvialis]|uniref:hypothetical protein n=1 Tax=Emticicia fluvialis TaxID=2974474 RepID=UPI002166AF3E|nr:hypothetical protein [Emticicia fluvialis]